MLKPARKPIPLPMGMVIFCYQNGWSIGQIARECGMSHGNIQKHLVREGVIINVKPQVRSDVHTDVLVAEYKKGMSKKALARKYGIGPSTVRYRLRKAGVA